MSSRRVTHNLAERVLASVEEVAVNVDSHLRLSQVQVVVLGTEPLDAEEGINMPLAALTAMSGFLLPVAVSLFFGEAVSGEANWGTLRYLLLRPVRRGRLLVAKLSVWAILGLVATVLIG